MEQTAQLEKLPQGLYRKPGTPFLQITYSVNGKQYRESSKSTDVKVAEKMRAARLREKAADHLGLATFATPKMRSVTVAELLESLKSDFRLRNKLSAGNESTIRICGDAFGDYRAATLTSEQISKYIERQLGDGYANATINRVTGMLGQAYALAVKENRYAQNLVPYIKHLSEAGNTRQGFVNREQFDTIHANLPDDLQDFALFAFLTGTRKSEIASLDWSNVQDGDTVIRFRPDQSKNKNGHSIPLVGELAEIIERRRVARTFDLNGTTELSKFVFHRGHGEPVQDFRKVWAKACELAGLPHLLFHDLRRSAVTAMVNAGVPQLVAQSLSNHKTASMFSRYNIRVESEQASALAAVAEYHKRKKAEAAAKRTNVVPLKQAK